NETVFPKARLDKGEKARLVERAAGAKRRPDMVERIADRLTQNAGGALVARVSFLIEHGVEELEDVTARKRLGSELANDFDRAGVDSRDVGHLISWRVLHGDTRTPRKHVRKALLEGLPREIHPLRPRQGVERGGLDRM